MAHPSSISMDANEKYHVTHGASSSSEHAINSTKAQATTDDLSLSALEGSEHSTNLTNPPTLNDSPEDSSTEPLSEDELNYLFDERFGMLISHIRQSSYDGVLATHNTWVEAEIMSDPFEPQEFIERVHAYLDDQELAHELSYDDIRHTNRHGIAYYWSSEYMSKTYLEMALVSASDNPLEQIAYMTRQECITYQRPLRLTMLTHPPFSLSIEQIDEALLQARETQDFIDIGEVNASNDDRYLYSTQTLSQAQARALAEYYSVEIPMNP